MATKKDVEEIKVPEGQEETKAEVTEIKSEDAATQNEKKMGTGTKLGIVGGLALLVIGLVFGGKKFLG